MNPMPSTQTTWEDARAMPDDGNRYEAIGGELYVTPAPRLRHQRVSQRLEWALTEILVEAGHGELLHAPVGVVFPTGEGVQPDIVFVSTGRASILGEEAIEGAPDLVIEIVSAGTAHRDRGVKLDLYERQGVAEYWIVDPAARLIETWRFDHDPRWERHHRRVPVRLGDQVLGEIPLDPVFRDDPPARVIHGPGAGGDPPLTD